MRSHWSETDAEQAIERYTKQGATIDVALRTYSTRLLGAEPQLVWVSSLLATCGLSLGFGLLVKSFALAAVQFHRRSPAELRQAYAVFTQRRRWSECLWCGFLPATLLGTGWLSWLNALEQRGWPGSLTLLGCMLPTALLILLVEITAAQVDELAEEAEQDAAEPGRSITRWPAHLAVRLRLGDMTSLLTCIAPVVLIAALHDLSDVVAVALLPADANRLGVSIAVTLTAGLLIALAWPEILSRVAGARPICDRRLHGRITAYQQAAGIRGVQLLCVSSRDRWVGAAVVGWFPWFRKLWLGDAIIARLSEQELDMVVWHELAHVRRRHYLWRLLPLLAAAAACWLLVIVVPGGQSATMASQGVQVVGFLLAGTTLAVSLGWVARRCELDADRWACELAARHSPWAQGSTTLPRLRLSRALAALLDETPGAEKATWLHPSLERRLANLRSATADRPAPQLG